MRENVTREDLTALQEFLDATQVPQLTNGEQVRTFEQEFAQWLGSKFAVMVNSGSSANLLSMAALRLLHGKGKVLVPCITWVSDIAAVLHAGLEPVFVDVDPETLGMNWKDAARKSEDALAIFPTHCLGFNAMNGPLPMHEREGKFIEPWVIEDCCEALGAYHDGRKVGVRGWMSNFSFYYAHHMSTIEGGMICTDDAKTYECLRMLRSHGLAREMASEEMKRQASGACPDLDPEFIFLFPAYNVRPTELNAVLGRSQLKRVDTQNGARTLNLRLFLDALGPKYRNHYRLYGSSNYALPVVLQEPDQNLFSKVIALLKELGVECRRGTAGGGNQLRQPYAKERWGDDFHKQFPQAEHIHQFGLYIGNYPSLERWKIEHLTEQLNAL